MKEGKKVFFNKNFGLQSISKYLKACYVQKGNKIETPNHISLPMLSIPGKLFEGQVYAITDNHVSKNNLLFSNQ